MKKFFAVVILILLWAVIPLTYIIFTVKFSLLTAAFYKEQLVEQDAYARTVAVIEASAPPEMEGVFRPGWLRVQVESVVDGTFSLLEHGAELEGFAAYVDFSEPKKNVAPFAGTAAGESGRVIMEFLNPLPDKVLLLAFINEYTRERPESEESDMYAVLGRLDEEPDISGNEALASLQNILEVVQSALRWLNIGLVMLAALFAFCVLGLALLVKRNAAAICGWLGNAFFVSGLVGVVAVVAQKIIFGLYLKDRLMRGFASMKSMSDILTDVVFGLVNDFLNLLLWPFGLTLGAGAALIIAALIIKRAKKHGHQDDKNR